MHYEKFTDGSVKCIEDEIPFEVPSGWEWTRLGAIFFHNTGKALNVSNTDGVKLTYITTSNLYWDRFELTSLKMMHFTDGELEKCTVTKGDLLVCEGGDIGRAAIWTYDENIRIQNHIHRLRPFLSLSTRFYYYVFFLWKLMGKIGGHGIGLQGFSSKALHNLIVPLPPVKEQIKISNCLDSIIAEINNIENLKEDISVTIEQAKSRILDLAIRGKLVPQDPNDEPASVLLERIRAEKEELIKQGKIKRDKGEGVIFKSGDSSHYERIPAGWEIASFSQLNYFQTSTINPSTYKDEYFELYSVPNYDLEAPEIVLGKEIGSAKQAVQNNDILLCKINPRLNRVWIVDKISKYRLMASSEWIVFRNPYIYSPYMRIYLTSHFFCNLMLTNLSGVGGLLTRAQPEAVKKYPIIVPPLNEQKRIVEKVQELMQQIEQIEKSLA